MYYNKADLTRRSGQSLTSNDLRIFRIPSAAALSGPPAIGMASPADLAIDKPIFAMFKAVFKCAGGGNEGSASGAGYPDGVVVSTSP